jgi:hypothetical protein
MPSSQTAAAWQRGSGGSAGGSDPALDRLKAVLDTWRSSLLDLGGRNRPLNFRHTRTATLEITAPDPSSVLAGLARGWSFAPVKVDDPVEGSSGGEAAAPGSGVFYEYDTTPAVGDRDRAPA